MRKSNKKYSTTWKKQDNLIILSRAEKVQGLLIAGRSLLVVIAMVLIVCLIEVTK